jgi:hypothetical protein
MRDHVPMAKPEDSEATPGPATSRTSAVKDLLRESLTSLVRGADPDALPPAVVPPELQDPFFSAIAVANGARDALLLIFAFRLVQGSPIDVSKRIEGDRTVSDFLGKEVLPDLGIDGVKSALEGRSFSHGFLSDEVRSDAVRAIAPFANDASVTEEQIGGMFWAFARGIAATAKVFKPLSDLDLHAMTFDRTLPLVEFLLGPPNNERKGSRTAGAHEQFLFAALLQAVYDDEDARLRVVTRSLNSSDKSARAAGDVEVVLGQARLVEAYEVTANSWETKMDKAAQTLNEFPELDRVHVVADSSGATGSEVRSMAEQAAQRAGRAVGSVDITVTGVREQCIVLLARASQRGRRYAIRTLHQHLVNRQSDMSLVDQLVDKCSELGLFE